MQGALRAEKDQKTSVALEEFLNDLGDMEAVKGDDRSLEAASGMSGLAASHSDQCSSDFSATIVQAPGALQPLPASSVFRN